MPDLDSYTVGLLLSFAAIWLLGKAVEPLFSCLDRVDHWLSRRPRLELLVCVLTLLAALGGAVWGIAWAWRAGR
jgi:hypothetical protein